MEYSKTRLIAQEMQKKQVRAVWQMETAILFINEQLPGDRWLRQDSGLRQWRI